MKTIVQPNQLELFAGTALDLCCSKSTGFSNRLSTTAQIRDYIRVNCTYPSGAIRASVEVRIAYVQLYEMLPKAEAKSFFIYIGIHRTTHYRWLKDVKQFNKGILDIRSYVKRTT